MEWKKMCLSANISNTSYKISIQYDSRFILKYIVDLQYFVGEMKCNEIFVFS